ncbi:conserved hypothetical protein [Talaromyces stipitatus ATCC 10500]|uniref:Putative transcriptional regulator tpeD n=1 Tax=Talaromyces stipitatus (strain ATCC 10500 / CBS 375.48 / QM 6759 / NRRL 1006) TaxID=441959 RepID=TPED_TALSN|nr:uncharacterized protein TSTA_008170 [Talaromyces stipitatus ATCC 10500]B8MV65.1 RecName: Full=Putative transcriptional regulator tpeD; AltName: Full=Polyesters biosynthesis cluster protein D; AltName: Full=Zinc finger BED domain-containing protein tpeD [Talaromyces stipitatus ATCC 10500]EED11521.1 conserved hypothetical protein [Talaromyces stipitatus ATCC 10500]
MSHSQCTQISDNYPPSLGISDDTSVSLCPSDGLQPFTPDLTYTHQFNFTQPAPLLPPPETLERVGPRNKKIYVLWTEMVNDDFVTWWLSTEYGSQMKRNIFEGKHQSECWQHFHQVAAIQDGSPKVMYKVCNHILSHPADRHRGTSSMNKHYSSGVNCRKSVPVSKDIKRLIQDGMHSAPQKTHYTAKAWMERLVTFITTSRLPFQLVEYPQFRALIEMAQRAPLLPILPCAKTIRNHLQELVQERQKSLLQKLSQGAKLSIALDCWTSPFRQSFMAVTGYFLDVDWNYREILLGFEPLSGSHTGAYLSTVLQQVLEEHQIEARILTVTTDNAANNSTLMNSLSESLQSIELPNQIPVIHIPCMAHIIQLSLNELLGRMEVNPRNDREEIEWTERDKSAQPENQDIIHTLEKIRRLAVFINRSPQRRENFLYLQSKEPKLVPIQDVRTRWNSTFLMLYRARKLQSTFDEYCSEYGQPDLKLTKEEWRQVDYLLSITKPFFTFTTSLSQTKEVTIHSVFAIYNYLFTHLEKSKEKLSEYYAMTDHVGGDLYAIGTILAPQNKLEFFSTSEWEPEWRVRYRKSLEEYIVPYEKRYSETQTQSIPIRQILTGGISDIDMLVTAATSLQPRTTAHDEISRYLGSSTQLMNPRIFWKDHQFKYPILASLAQYILTTPASGSGVERLFNSARDICHYRRGSLKPHTIKELMLFMCTTKFDLESEELSLMDEYLTTQEIQRAREERDAQQALEAQNTKYDFDPISDSEEAESEDESLVLPQSPQASQARSQRSLGKRPAREEEPLIELDGNEEDEVPLPYNRHLVTVSSTQRRSSGRQPKRSKRDEDFVYETP